MICLSSICSLLCIVYFQAVWLHVFFSFPNYVSYFAETAFAFVYREVHLSNPVPDNAVSKRKAGICYVEDQNKY